MTYELRRDGHVVPPDASRLHLDQPQRWMTRGNSAIYQGAAS
jgi:hypothetical protein